LERSGQARLAYDPIPGVDFFYGEVFVMTDTDKLIKTLQEMYPNGKISCQQARELAKKMDIELAEMGDLCDAAGVKIYGCELGCF